MVRKQNERTILLHSRIIQLSLPIQSFHILAPLAPFLQDWELSLSPETFSRKFFSEIFSNLAKATFFWIFGAKNYGGRGHLSLPK